jgi:hypothetical protein
LLVYSERKVLLAGKPDEQGKNEKHVHEAKCANALSSGGEPSVGVTPTVPSSSPSTAK